VIAVRDRGIGIAAADRERIFDEFFRAPDVDRSQVPGTGLGLTVVAHIAKAHQARIDVDSRPGEGSTFSLSFPIPPASESALVGAAP
jgi:signal transduction histidine kinase